MCIDLNPNHICKTILRPVTKHKAHDYKPNLSLLCMSHIFLSSLTTLCIQTEERRDPLVMEKALPKSILISTTK